MPVAHPLRCASSTAFFGAVPAVFALSAAPRCGLCLDGGLLLNAAAHATLCCWALPAALEHHAIDYAGEPLLFDGELRQRLLVELAELGAGVEQAFGGVPQVGAARRGPCAMHGMPCPACWQPCWRPCCPCWPCWAPLPSLTLVPVLSPPPTGHRGRAHRRRCVVCGAVAPAGSAQPLSWREPGPFSRVVARAAALQATAMLRRCRWSAQGRVESAGASHAQLSPPVNWMTTE